MDDTRKRSLWLLLLVAVLLVVLVLWLAFARPDLGAYPSAHRFGIHVLWLLVSFLFGRGTFGLITGAPGEGPFRAVRGSVGVLVGIVATIGFGVGALLLDLTLTHERTATSDSDRDHDWDWD